MISWKIDHEVIIYQDDKEKISKVRSNNSYYFYKIIKGRKESIDLSKNILERRLLDIGSMMKSNVYQKEEQIEIQKINENQYYLHVRRPWIQCEDIITYIQQEDNKGIIDKTQQDKTQAQQLNFKAIIINNIICQFIAKILLAPNNFFYSYQSLLYNLNNDDLSINYFSFSTDDFMKNYQQVSKKSLFEALNLLQLSSDKQIISYKPLNKFRAVADLLLTLIKQKRIQTINQNQINQKIQLFKVKQHLLKRNQQLQKLIVSGEQTIRSIQDQNNTKYFLFLSQVFGSKKVTTWNRLINQVIPQFNNQKASIQTLEIIAIKIGKVLFANEDIYFQKKLIDLGIVEVSPLETYELYLKTKLASSKEELILLLRLSKLTDLFHIDWETYEEGKDKLLQSSMKRNAQAIFKSLCSIVCNIQQYRKKAIYNQEKEILQQNQLSEDQLRQFLKKISQKMGSNSTYHFNIEVKSINSQARALKKYLNL